MKSFYSYLMMGIIICSCAEDEPQRKNAYSEPLKSTEDSLFHEVMEGHDAGMAKMGRITRYLEDLEIKTDSLIRLKKNVTFYDSLRSELKEAQEQMNKWMNEFKIDTLKQNAEQRLRYLEEEKHKVTVVRDKILNSIRRYDSAFRIKK